MIKFLKNTLILLLLLFSSVSYAIETADSILNKINSSNGIEKIRARFEYSYIYRRNDKNTSLEHAELALKEIRENYPNSNLEAEGIYYKALPIYYDHKYEEALDLFVQSVSLAKKWKDHHLLGNIYFFMGSTYYFHYGDTDETFRYYNLCIEHSILSDNYRILGAVYSSLSNIYRGSGAYEKALELAYKSKENYAKANFREGLAWAAYTMGTLYYSVGLPEDAKDLYGEALSEYRILAKYSGINTGIAICLDQLTNVHSDLGNVDIARAYNNESIGLYKKQSSKAGLSVALNNKALLENSIGNSQEALELLDSSRVLKLEIKDVISLAGLYQNYGKILISLGEYDSAEDSLIIGLNYAKQHNQNKHLVNINKLLSKIYLYKGDYKKAFFYKDNQANLADSITSAKLTKSMVKLENIYEIESKERTIQNLEEQNKLKDESLKREFVVRRLLTLVLFFALTILALLVYFFIEKQRANRKLAESKKHVDEINATKDKFFSIIAHDLKAPFSSILGLSNLLVKDFDTFDKEKSRELIYAINQSSKTSFDLLNNLLEWSRSQRNTIPFVPEVLDIDSLFENIKELLNSNLEAKNINLRLNPHGAKVFADMNMMHTIVRNLISNAIKYSKLDTEIVVDYKIESDKIVFSIEDQGVGISSENISRLFKVDDQYYREGTSGEKGTGLGLIITKEFLEKHGGEIWIKSKPGLGSTFYFSIPHK